MSYITLKIIMNLVGFYLNFHKLHCFVIYEVSFKVEEDGATCCTFATSLSGVTNMSMNQQSCCVMMQYTHKTIRWIFYTFF